MSSQTITTTTVDPTDPTTWTPEYMAEIAAKAAKDAANKAAAKAKRERSNDRPFLNGSTTERMNATQANYTVLADMLRNWAVTYKDEPATLVQRLTDTIVPMLTNLGNTDSLAMSTAQDGARHAFASFKVPTVVQPAETVPLPGGKNK